MLSPLIPGLAPGGTKFDFDERLASDRGGSLEQLQPDDVPVFVEVDVYARGDRFRSVRLDVFTREVHVQEVVLGVVRNLHPVTSRANPEP